MEKIQLTLPSSALLAETLKIAPHHYMMLQDDLLVTSNKPCSSSISVIDVAPGSTKEPDKVILSVSYDVALHFGQSWYPTDLEKAFVRAALLKGIDFTTSKDKMIQFVLAFDDTFFNLDDGITISLASRFKMSDKVKKFIIKSLAEVPYEYDTVNFSIDFKKLLDGGSKTAMCTVNPLRRDGSEREVINFILSYVYGTTVRERDLAGIFKM